MLTVAGSATVVWITRYWQWVWACVSIWVSTHFGWLSDSVWYYSGYRELQLYQRIEFSNTYTHRYIDVVVASHSQIVLLWFTANVDLKHHHIWYICHPVLLSTSCPCVSRKEKHFDVFPTVSSVWPNSYLTCPIVTEPRPPLRYQKQPVTNTLGLQCPSLLYPLPGDFPAAVTLARPPSETPASTLHI